LRPLLLHVTADADERALVQKLANAVRAGHPDDAADTLASHLQRAYDNGFSDGHAEASGVGRGRSGADALDYYAFLARAEMDGSERLTICVIPGTVRQAAGARSRRSVPGLLACQPEDQSGGVVMPGLSMTLRAMAGDRVTTA
jgi:hypothetical protein